MHHPRFRTAAVLGLAGLVFAGCAHRGPVVPVAPALRFVEFNSVALRPEGIEFRVRLDLKNRMPVPLPLDRLDYRLDLNGRRFLTGSFRDFKAFGGRSRQTVTLPFRLAYEDLVAHAIAGEHGPGYRVAFEGDLRILGDYPFAVIPIRMEKTLPVPRMPEITLAGTEGSPVGERFEVLFRVKNTNTFPVWVKAVDASLDLNDQSYDLLHAGAKQRFEPGQEGTLVLEMRNTLGKAVGMFANVLLSGKSEFKAAGRLRFGTPFGDLFLPFGGRGSSR